MSDAASTSKGMRVTGWVLTGIAIAFLVFDAVIHLGKEQHAVASMRDLGWDVGLLPAIGAIEAACLVLYCIPRTAVLGAVLLTGYFGGAIATNWRAGMPMFNDVFPLFLALFVWGGLYLRSAQLRALFPLVGSARPEA
jgi:hypothetical protein